MADAPQPQIVYPQNPITSKTVLVNIFGSILVWAVAKYGLGAIFSADVVNEVATALAMTVMSAANIVIRKYTTGALSFSAPLSQPVPQTLPVGSVAITTPHPSTPGSVSLVSLPPGEQTLTVPPAPAPPPAAAAPMVVVGPQPPNAALGG